MATLRQEMKNLRSELQEHRVNAMDGNPRTVDPNRKRRPNAARFCIYCRTNWHTPRWCCKKIRDEKLKRFEKKELPRKKSPLLRTTEKNEDKIMDQNDRLEAKFFKEEIRILIMMNLQEIFPHPIRNSLHGQTSYMVLTIQTMEDPLINAQISHSKEAMENDPEMDLSIIRMGPGETMETHLVLHRLKRETSHKIVHTASQEVINLTILLSTDLTIDLRRVLRLTNKSFHKRITRRHLIRFVRPLLTKPLLK